MATEFSKRGYPLISVSSNKVVMLTDEESTPIISSNREVEPVAVGNFKAIPWYDDNDFPQKADKIISETPVLKRALGDLTKITMGQGIFPCEVVDTLDTGQEVLKMIKDPVITNQLQSYVIRRYLAKTLYDVNSYGSAWVQFIPNIEGTKILKLNPVNALKGRMEMFDNNGKVNNLLVSGKWPDPEAKDIAPYLLLDEIDPFEHLTRLKDEGALKGKTVFMQLKNSFSSNDFYPLPNWYTAKLWIDISQKVPKIINAGMDNVLNIFFLIRIPISYWEEKYPEDEFETQQERKNLIQADIEKLETQFTSVENARKALITHFGYNEGSDDKWEIEIKEPKFSQENFVTSNAADTQTAIATGISPDLLGLMYGNSKGGSMQRELLLLQYALSWESRQLVADPVEMMLKFNGADENLQLRFRNTFLTTLDTGAGTSTQLS
ncbi:MAG: hypothetical protein P1P88_01245 [Bacteroidales bacterium]|nr:hypothetical protein [Bacteroidales bacterium]